MNKIIRRAVVAALCATAGVGAAIVTATPGYTAAKGGTLRRAVAEPLNSAIAAVNKKDFATALMKAQEADMTADKTKDEDFKIAQVLGAIALQQPMPDYAAAAAAYDRQIASGGLPEESKAETYELAMKLHYQLMDYPKVIASGSERMKLAPLDDTGNLIMTQAYYNTMDYANASATAKIAVAAAAAKGQKPDEDLLALLLNSQQKTGDTAGAQQTLDQLALVSTRPDAWSIIVDGALGTPGLKDHDYINLYRVSMLVGTMKDVDYDGLATLDLKNNLPAEAKDVLTKGNRNGELMKQADMFLARDKDTVTGLTAEAAKHKDGEIDVILGETHMSYSRYPEAIAAIQNGIMKGGLANTADAQTTLGIALYKAGRKDEAAQAFQQAEAANTPTAKVAHVWSLYLKREMTPAAAPAPAAPPPT